MKIVIAQHECFNIPINIIKRYFELKGEIPYFYEFNIDKSTSPHTSIYNLTTNPKNRYTYNIVNKYFGETCTNKEIYSDAMFDERGIERTDENLIKAIDELKSTNLKVVEIPDDVKWYIHESEEGYESIHEEHRSWY